MSDTSLVYDILARDRASPVVAKAGHNVRSAGNSSRAGSIAMAAGFASAAAWAIALGAAVRPAVGAIALVPGAAFAAASAVGVLAVASKGLGAAWKAATTATGGGGGAAASTAKAVAAAQKELKSATKGLADAERDLAKARQGVNVAYAEAAERLEDLSRQVAGVRLDEEAAVLAVGDAERDLQKIRRGGNPHEIAKADLAYRQSIQTLDEVRDRLDDVTKENDKAQAAGLEGSDEVKSAREREREATEQLQEATERLAEAQRDLADAGKSAGGGANAAAAAMAKLSKNQRAVIQALLSLRAAWRPVMNDLKDAVWKDVNQDILALSTAYLPVARKELQAVGGAWNTAIRASLGMFRSAGAVENVRQILANTAPMVATLGQAFARIASALLNVGAGGSAWLPRISQWVLDISSRFERWIAAARESGKLDQWIGAGLTTLKQLGQVALNVGKFINAIFNAGTADGFLAKLVQVTDQAQKWANTAEGQERIGKALAFLRGILGNVVDLVRSFSGESTRMDGVVSTVKTTLGAFGDVLGFVSNHIGVISKILPVLIGLWLLEKAGIGPSTLLTWLKVRAMIAHSAALRANTSAMRAHTAAMTGNTAGQGANTGATNVGVIARLRSVASWVAARTATIASTVATRAAAAGQWLLNTSMYGFPLVWIILAVVAVVAIFVLLYNKCEWFRNGVDAIFGWIVAGLKLWWTVFSTVWTTIGGWFVALFRGWWNLFTGFWGAIFNAVATGYDWVIGKIGALVGWVQALPGRLAAAGRGMWSWMGDTFRSAVNGVIGAWNRLHFSLPSLSIAGQTVFSGFTLNTPDIPYLASGGDIQREGIAYVHAGERVMPAAEVERTGGVAGGQRTVVLDLRGDREVVTFLRKLIRKYDLLEG